jgi:AraC-like DNA-binding protein
VSLSPNDLLPQDGRKEARLVKEFPARVLQWSPRGYREPLHWHNALEVGYCIEGRGQFFFSEKEYPTARGDVFVVNNFERHIAQADPEAPSRFIFLYFDGTLFDFQERELLLPFVYNPKEFTNRIPATHPVARQIGTLMELMWTERQFERTAYRLMIKAAVTQICVLLLRHYGQSTTRQQWTRAYALFQQIQPALGFLQENFREDVTPDQVAARLSLSPSRARHLFKEVVGEGIKDFLSELRVNEAKRLLIETALPVTDVYLSCGFQSHASFYRTFKEVVGVTPSEYRNRFSMLAALDHVDEYRAWLGPAPSLTADRPPERH